MKCSSWNAFCAMLFTAGMGVAGEALPVTVAVFDFSSPDELIREVGPQVASVVNATLSTETDLLLVERADLEKVLGEQELGLSGTVNTATAARVGQLTGAKVLVTGRVFLAGDEQVIVAKIIGTETSRVCGEMVKSTDASITDLSVELAGKIARTIPHKVETLVAEVSTPEDRVEALRKALGDAPRPAVRVSIPERHFGGLTFDPAVETEFGKILTECGFKLFGEKSDAKPEIEFLGEAFSEFGMRRGNLVVCKARVEVKVRDVATGDILGVDRQTVVAVDLSEQIAGKKALQEAASKVAVRVVPKAVR